jgi:predicted nucleic acid-binding protein
MRILLADAGPLIALSRIEKLHLLHDLFTTVWITEVIAAELGLSVASSARLSFSGLSVLQEACQQGWLQVVKPEPVVTDGWSPLNPGVDAGEASAIALAIQQRDAGRDVLLLIDDRCGRAEARRQGLAVIGTTAVLVLAKERRLVSTCKPLLVALREEGYFLSDSLIASVLQQCGESAG